MSHHQTRLLRLVVLLVWLTSITSILAQDAPTETPTETPIEVVTDIPTDAPTEITSETPTEAPTDIVTEAPTQMDTPTEETPTEIAPTAETPAPTNVPVETQAPVIPSVSIQSGLAPEPALTLSVRELFQDETGQPALPADWVLPAGWTLQSTANEGSLHIDAALAEPSSHVTLNGSYPDMAAMGYFTFVDQAATAQIFVRESADGRYEAALNNGGLVTLSKQDSQGIFTVLATASTPLLDGAHGLRLSAIGGVLRVSVDNVEVIAVQDAQPLLAGGVSVGVSFPGSIGAIDVDNVFVWLPATSPEQPTAIPTTSPTEVPSSIDPVTGKSTVLRNAPRVFGVMSSGNDDFTSRLSALAPYVHTGDTIGNSKEGGEPTPTCGFNITNTAWYQFTPPAGGLASETFIITSADSTFDTMLAVYTDSNGGAANLGDLIPVAGGCSDDVTGSLQARVSLTLNDNTTYYVQLGGYNGSVGNFTFSLLRTSDTLVPAAPAISLIAAGAPAAPIANGAPTKALDPVVAWTATGAVVPYSYDIQISTTTGFSSPIADTTLEPQRYYRPTLPAPSTPTGQVYYWHVRARNILNQASPWSATYTFRLDTIAPNPPSLTAPAVNGVVNSFRPTFSWATVADAAQYHLQLASNFSCSTILQTKLASTPTAKFDADLAQGEYWFCVKAIDAAGNEGGFGEKRRFIVNASTSPAHGTLFVPTGAATSMPVKLTWTGVPSGTYQVEIATDSSFTSLLVPPFNVTGLTTTLPIGFGEYFWRVNSGGSLYPSLAWKFTVSPPVPLAPVISPNAIVPNQSVTADTTPLLAWNRPANWLTPPLAQSLYYQIELSTNSGFTALIAPTLSVSPPTSNPNHEWTNTTLNSGTTYYWHVRAVTNLGISGPYSPTYSFTVDTDAPASPTTLIAPVDNVVLSTARPTFSWSKVADAKSYLVELASDSGFNNPLAGSPFPATTPSLILPTSLPQDPVDIVYWRVLSKDPAGNISSGAGSRAFRVDYALTPAEGYAQALPTGITAAPVKFTWAAVPGVTGTPYSVNIYDSASLASPIAQSGTIAGTTWTSPALDDGEYWWALTVNDTVLGPLGTSGARRFVVSLPLPGAPAALFTLTGGSPTKDTMPQFNWGNPTLNAGSVADYELQISTVNTFATQVVGSPYIVTARPFEITTALPDTPGQVYYWRVRARTTLGAGGPFTLPQSFKLDTTRPNAPLTLTAPADLFVSTNGKPAFSWAAVADSKYRIEIATDNGFSNLIPTPATVITPSYTQSTPLTQGAYYWQVWSIDSAGNESLTASAVRSFTVDYRTAPTANAFTHTAAANANVTFSWTPVPGVGYTIEIDPDLDGDADQTVGPFTTTSTIVNLAQGDYQYRLVTTSLGTSAWRPFFVAPLVPGAPVGPFTITGGTPTGDTTPTFNWGAPTVNLTSVTGYKLEIATTSNFTVSQIAGSPFDVGNVTTYTLPGANALPATAGQIYYWRVQPKMQFNKVGSYGTTQVFVLDTTAPNDVTTLTAPLDNAVLSTGRPTFTWTPPVGGAASYIFELSQNSGTFSPLVLTGLPTKASYISELYLQQGTYYWRVRSRDAAANQSAAYSPVRAFVVNYSTSPAANAVIPQVTPTHITFKWAAVPGTVSNTIRLEIDNNSDFSSVTRRSPALPVTTASYSTSMAFSVGSSTALPFGKYYWRVLIAGHAAWPTTLAQSFTISPAAPPAPVLSTTTPAASTADPSPTFQWTAVASPAGATVTGYELQLATASTFAPASLVGGASVSLGTTTSYTWAPDLPDSSGTLYYARIRAITNLAQVSAWSASRTFTLDTTAPLIAPVLIAPANGGSVTTQKPTFQWGAVTGATRYEIRYGTQTNLGAITPVNVATLTHVPAGNLLFTNYYWEVRAIDAAGNAGPWSTQRVVKVTSAVGVAPSLWSYTAMPTLSWTPLYWATSYSIEVSRTSAFAVGDIVWQSSGIAATDTPSVTVGAALPNGTYYWRLRGKKPDPYGLGNTGFGPYSLVNSFSIEAP